MTRLPNLPPSRKAASLTRRGFLVASGGGGLLLLTGCGLNRDAGKGPEDLIAWPSEDRWPERLQMAHPEIQETYHWAARNKETLQWFPCTCGCVDTDDHQSNFDCYVAEEYDDGSVLLDLHSFG